MNKWNCNKILLQKSDLGMISAKANFHLYLFSNLFSMCTVVLWGNYPRAMMFHGATPPREIPIHEAIASMYFRPMGSLYLCLQFYIRSD